MPYDLGGAPPGLRGFLLSRQNQAADQQNELRGLLGILSIQNQMAQQQRLQQMAPLEMALKKAQIDAIPEQAKLRAAQTQEALAKIDQGNTQRQALSGLAGLLSTGGYQGNAENPVVSPPTGVMTDPNAALAAARAADARGERVNINVPNPALGRALALQADRTGGLMGKLYPQNGQQRPTVIPAGAGVMLPGEIVPSYTQPTSPKSEPLVIIQTPNGPRYATRSEAAGQTAPVPGAAANERAAAKEAEKKAQAARGFEAANTLIDDIITNVDKNPGTVGATGFVNRIIEGVTEQVPGMQGTYGTSATNVATKLNLLQSTIYRDLVGAGQLSVADYKHIGEIIRGKGLLDSPQATKDALEQVRTFLKAKLPGAVVPNSGARPKAEDFFR